MEPIDPETAGPRGAAPGAPAPGTGRDAEMVPPIALDPVDLALLMKASPERSAARATKRRYASLVTMLIVFVVLIVLGLLMASHVHTTGAGTNGVVGTLRPFSSLGPG